LKNLSWTSVPDFAFVASVLSLAFLIIHTAFNITPLSILEADSIKVRAENNVSSSSSSLFSCISYVASTRTITVSCSAPVTLTDIFNTLHDSSVLSKESGDGVWFLNANLIISSGASVHIDPTDTKWLKISSKVTGGRSPSYTVVIHGTMKIDSVKVTSWDPTTNYYAVTNGSRTGAGAFIFGSPRPSIYVDFGATGTMNITNSEIGYLGYEQGKRKGGSGLSYYGGDGSVLRNNDIHDLYFGLYTFGVGHMSVENNIVRNSGHYGLDPHTKTHDMIIRNNIVYNNNGSAIICSLDCYNILIENNKVYDNTGPGINFSRNMTDSIVRNNVVYNQDKGIFVSQSHNNQIYNNVVSNSKNGIDVGSGSSNNKIYNNTIVKSTLNAISVDGGSSSNIIYSNVIKNSSPFGIYAKDPTTINNIFYNNQLIDSLSAISPKNKIGKPP
jgi:mannuronan 5-epimerase